MLRKEGKEDEMSKLNREYKNSVFKDLFSDEAAVLKLYNALTNSHFTLDDGLNFTTLENALFMDRLNDISFTIGDKLVVLIEHQSSVNENMPLRALMYIGRVYEKIIDSRAIYRSMLFTIPTPEFYVLYNGEKDYPDEVTLRLSDAFRNTGTPGVGQIPALDLAVSVVNINKGRNEDILERCEVLRDYAAFIGEVRAHQQAGLTLQDSITSAIDICIGKGILAEYLKSNSSEVRNMIFTEFNLEEAKEVWLEEERLKMAREMFMEGISLEKIVRISSLPLDTLKEKLQLQ